MTKAEKIEKLATGLAKMEFLGDPHFDWSKWPEEAKAVYRAKAKAIAGFVVDCPACTMEFKEIGAAVRKDIHLEHTCGPSKHEVAIKDCLEYAGGRWDEWGSRAEACEDILRAALEGSNGS